MQDNYVLHTAFDETDVVEPITLAEAKDYLVISQSETAFDDKITELITTSRELVEDYLNMSLVDKTVIARVQNEAGFMHLPYIGDTITITGVVDSDGTTIEESNYTLQDDLFCGSGGTVGTPANNFYEPCNTGLQITYDVAYPNGIKSKFKTAIKQQLSWLYENPGDDEALSPVVKTLMKRYRRVF